MKHIWRYCQLTQGQNVVIVCPTRDIVWDTIKDILDKFKRHSVLNSDKLEATTHSMIKYNSNRVMAVTSGFDFIELRGFTIHVLLLSSQLDERQRTEAMWSLIQQMPARGERIIATYLHKGEYNE